MSDLSAPVFNGTVYQCQPVAVSWTGGVFPVRVAAFYQENPTDDWKSAGLTSEAANSHVIEWQANAPAGSTAWMTLVDHSGTYRQTTSGVIVQASDDSSCLDNAKTAPVVTQTVYMSGKGESYLHRSGLDDRSLTILAIVFGISFFIALAGALYLFSLLRQARKIKRGPRFSLGEEEDDSYSTLSGLGAGAATGLAAAATKGKSSRRSFSQEHKSNGAPLTVMSAFPPSKATAYSNYQTARTRDSVTSEDGIAVAAASSPSARESTEASPPNSSSSRRPPTPTPSEHNPFLDAPIAPNNTVVGLTDSSSSIFRYPENATRTFRSSDATAVEHTRPGLVQKRSSNSAVYTLGSAQSMQHVWQTGPLRVTNDPRFISTPDISRINTRSSSFNSRHPYNESSVRLGRAPSSASEEGPGGSTVLSTDSGSTADHYDSEKHNSRVWSNGSASGKASGNGSGTPL